MIENLLENTESKGIFVKKKVDCKLAEGREEMHSGIRYIHTYTSGMYGLDSLGLFISARELGLNRAPVLISAARKVSLGRRTTSPASA